MIAPDKPFNAPLPLRRADGQRIPPLCGGEMIPLLPPAVYTSRRLDVEHGHRRPFVTLSRLRLRFARRPTCWATASTREPISGPGTAAIASVNSLAVADGFGRGLVTGGKAVVNSFVAVATLGYVPEAIPVTSEDRGNGYDTAALFGRIGWSAFFAAAGMGLADADVCLSNACFAAGTPLLTPDGAKPIEEFKVGDLVLSAPEDDPNGPVAARRVEKVFQRLARIVELRVGGQAIRTTHEHPFYVQGKGWTKAAALSAGDLLKSNEGHWVPVESLSDTNEDTTVYNLRIEEYHTYFVGCAEWGFSVCGA